MARSKVRVYTDCNRVIDYSYRTVSAEESNEVIEHLRGLRPTFHCALQAVPTETGHVIVPVNRIHTIDIIRDLTSDQDDGKVQS